MGVTALGVVCSLVPLSTAEPHLNPSAGSLRFSLDEFVVLDDSTRVVFRSDRGFGISNGPDSGHPPLTESEFDVHLSIALLPDEGIVEDAGERLAWHEYSELLEHFGISASPESLKACPLIVDLAPEVRRIVDGW